MAKKLYYKIGEACKLLEIQPYVLRYWETEFPFLTPDKSKSGQRVYSEPELEVIRRIKELLYEEGYTIAGAKKRLEAERDGDDGAAPGPTGAAETRPAGEMKPRRSSKPAAGKGNRSTAAKLDGTSQEKVEKLRAGLKKALGQTRKILELLGSEAN